MITGKVLTLEHKDADEGLCRYIKLKCEMCGLPRTNNSVEGWHHGFQSMIGSDHPQIYSFIKSILKEQSITDVAKSRLAAGSQRPISAKSQYVRCGRRIQSLIQ